MNAHRPRRVCSTATRWTDPLGLFVNAIPATLAAFKAAVGADCPHFEAHPLAKLMAAAEEAGIELGKVYVETLSGIESGVGAKCPRLLFHVEQFSVCSINLLMGIEQLAKNENAGELELGARALARGDAYTVKAEHESVAVYPHIPRQLRQVWPMGATA